MLQHYIETFSTLGDFIDQFLTGVPSEDKHLEEINADHFEAFEELIKKVSDYNPWFTEESVIEALRGIRLMLHKETLEKWLSDYPLLNQEKERSKDIGVVMAGNIPLVGFHDLLCVLLSGNRLIAKPSSKDEHLIKALAEVLISIQSSLSDKIIFVENYLKDIDAIIATGSNNTSRHFNYYFRNIPKIIRKNRNSIAVLTGSETDAQIAKLGIDIFSFYGLGCRNVTKLYLPENFDLTRIMRIYESYGHMYDHYKYANNIEYHRAIYLMNNISFLDNGSLLLKEDTGLSSPVGVVYYEKYSEIEDIKRTIVENRDLLQCIVSIEEMADVTTAPGDTQKPLPWDYADGIDTLKFLTEI